MQSRAERPRGRARAPRPNSSGLDLATTPILHQSVFSPSQGIDELLPVVKELGDTPVEVAGDLVESQEERHLALPKSIQDLPIVLRDPEDALAVGDQFDLGEMMFESGLVSQVFISAPNSLQGHPSVEKSPYDPERYEIAERVKTPYAGPAACGLNRRFD